jgi:hypothetical protein
MSLREDIREILTATGVHQGDLETLLRDEHARYRLYLEALTLAPATRERDLIAAVLRDPDRIMAEAAVVAHADRQATLLRSYESFSAWARRIADLIEEYDFLQRRLNEWQLFKRIIDGAEEVNAVHDASDWLQRKLSEEAISRTVLTELAATGRTKRVRNVAQSRLKQTKT